MNTKRSTNDEMDERCEAAANLLAEGWPGHSIVAQLAKKYDVTPQQSRHYVRKGRELLVESVGVQNRAALFSQIFAGLQMDRMEARHNGNSAAAVGASKAMVQMLSQLGKIDPFRDFEDSYVDTAAAVPSRKGSIPRESIYSKTNPLDDLDATLDELRSRGLMPDEPEDQIPF